MKIYFDTEFTTLESEHPSLISIGFACDNGETFYGELTDIYSKEDCSDFCKKEVLIHLENNEKVNMTLNQLRSNLTVWFKDKKGYTLVCDSYKDIEQFKRIFPMGFPHLMKAKKLGWFGTFKRSLLKRIYDVYKKHNLRTHHALDDAKANLILLEDFF